jgi:putative DNA primase/helicase
MANNADLIAFLQRAVGYSLTGKTGERVIFILYGSGANGKSTLIETIRFMLGGYASRTPTQTLMIKQTGSIPNDIARLRGQRFVSAAESEQGQRLAESLIKDLTGNETVSARFMRAEWFEFKPEFKIWLSTNNKPQVTGTDNAIWDRIRLIPFNVTIPPEQRDPKLQDKLRGELPGILRWAVQGCLDWQRSGLGVPLEVAEAMKAYRTEMDILKQFISDRCELKRDAEVSKAALHEAFSAWCSENGETELSKKEFGGRMKKYGLDEKKSGSTRYWRGIRLLQRAEA